MIAHVAPARSSRPKDTGAPMKRHMLIVALLMVATLGSCAGHGNVRSSRLDGPGTGSDFATPALEAGEAVLMFALRVAVMIGQGSR